MSCDRCDRCDRNYQAVYRVPNEVWAKIAPSPETLGPNIEHQYGGMLCPDCAAVAAKGIGLNLIFVAEIWDGEAKPEPVGKPSWADAPDWAQWLAQDWSGIWFWFGAMPEIPDGVDCWFSSYLGDQITEAGGTHTPAPNWRDTLEARP